MRVFLVSLNKFPTCSVAEALWLSLHPRTPLLSSPGFDNNKPAPFQTETSRLLVVDAVSFSPPTFLKFRFRVLFWRHSQTQLSGSLDDQIRALPVPISSIHKHLRHRSQSKRRSRGWPACSWVTWPTKTRSPPCGVQGLLLRLVQANFCQAYKQWSDPDGCFTTHFSSQNLFNGYLQFSLF